MALRGDQQRRTALRCVEQLPGRGDIEPQAAAQRAGQVIRRGEATPVEIEPQLAVEGELVALPALAATRALLDGQSVAVVEHEGGQGLPATGHVGLRGIGGLALHARAAQGRVVGIAPGFLARPWFGRQMQRDARQHLGAARVQGQHPLARPQLDAQAPVVLQPRRQVALQRRGHEAGGQRRPQQQFARAAGDVELQLRFQPRRHAVGQAAEHAHRQRIGGALRGGRFAQGELVAVALDAVHGAAIQGQGDQADRLGHAQACGAMGPGQRAAQCIVAGFELHGRRIAMRQYRRRLAVDGDLLRPLPFIARQGHPAARVHVHVQAEAGAILARVEQQPSRPCARALAGQALSARHHRAGVRGHVVQHPVLPVAQRRRRLLRQHRRGQQQEQCS